MRLVLGDEGHDGDTGSHEPGRAFRHTPNGPVVTRVPWVSLFTIVIFAVNLNPNKSA